MRSLVYAVVATIAEGFVVVMFIAGTALGAAASAVTPLKLG